MQILRKIFILTLIIVISVTLTINTLISTFASSSSSINNGKIANVAVLLHNFEDLYSAQLMKSLENIQAENSDEVQFSFFDGKDNTTIQNETLDFLVKSNIDLLIANLANSNEEVLKEAIFKAKSNNIPLILIEVDLEIASKVSKYYDKLVFTSLKTQQAGIIEGKILANLWKNKKEVIDKNKDNALQYILLEGRVGSPVAAERSKFAVSTINESGIKTEELARVNAGWLKGQANNAINNLLLRYDGKIEAIISNNDAMAIGAIEALQRYGYNTGDKSKYIPVVGIDGLSEAKDLVDKGVMAGTAVQDPNVIAKDLYIIGMNLINNINPAENTDFKYFDKVIEIPLVYEEYSSQRNE